MLSTGGGTEGEASLKGEEKAEVESSLHLKYQAIQMTSPHLMEKKFRKQ